MNNAAFNPEQATIALTTTHGSRLYGLAHATSDQDTYTVFTDAPDNLRHQSLKGADDQFWISLDQFLLLCADGTPQALEAMFSPMATCSPLMEAYRATYRAPLGAMRMKYRRTVANFAEGDTLKKRRHALRLALNLTDAERLGGRFNPTMTAERAAWLTATASLDNDEYMDTLDQTMNGSLFAG